MAKDKDAAPAPTTDYLVFKDVSVGLAPDGPPTLIHVPVGNASAHNPKQAIRLVASTIESIDGLDPADPNASRLGAYHAAPASSWHSGEVTEKPAEITVA